MFPPDDEYFQYYDHNDPKSIQTAVDDLEQYIADEGPFDAVLAYSMGVALAATVMIRQSVHHPVANGVTFKMAVFLSGSPPYDYAALTRGEIRMYLEGTDGVKINMPTAHIWGSNDQEWSHAGIEVVKICNPDVRYQYLHGAGHQIPNSPPEVVVAMAATVKSAIDAVAFTQ